MKKLTVRRVLMSFVGVIVFCLPLVAAAATDKTVGTLATTVVTSISGLAKLVVAGAFVAGMGFAVGAILKFKQHKDNPTQIPVGTPIALIFIAAALMFLPSVFGTLGKTVFGDKAAKGSVGGIASGYTGKAGT